MIHDSLLFVACLLEMLLYSQTDIIASSYYNKWSKILSIRGSNCLDRDCLAC